MVRTRATWLAYLLLGGYAHLQAAPGAIVPFLRAELALNYTTAALHLTLFAAGALLAGATEPAVERRLGRTAAAWLGAAGLSAATLVLAAGRSPTVTLAATFAMGWVGTWTLVAVQAALADEHRAARAVALSESNVLASIGAPSVPVAVATAEGVGPGWRAGLLVAVVAFAVLALAFRRVTLVEDSQPDASAGGTGPLPAGAWAGLVLLGAGVAAEWSVGFWAASFLAEVSGLPAASAVGASTGFYAAMLVSRMLGSVMVRSIGTISVLGIALALATAGFPLFWLAPDPVLAIAGLVLVGLGLGCVFPLSLALAIGAAPAASTRISALGVQAGSLAVISLPLGLGALAAQVTLRPAFAVVPVLLTLALIAWWTARRALSTRGIAPPMSSGGGRCSISI